MTNSSKILQVMSFRSRVLSLMMVLAAVGLVPAMSAAQSATAQNSINLVHNGGFERGTDEWTWMTSGAQATGALDPHEKHSGLQSYRMTNASGFAPNRYGRIYQTINGMRPYTTYRISAWVKGKGVGIAWIGGGPGWFLRQRFPTGDFDWQQVTTDYTTGPNVGDFDLMVLMESQVTSLWVDDVEMREIGADTEKRASAERELQTTVNDELAHLSRVRRDLTHHPSLETDRYILLGMAVAKRFLDRVQLPASKLRQSAGWSRLQVEEVKEVLDATEVRIDQALKSARPGGVIVAERGNNVRQPLAGKVLQRGGVFLTSAAPLHSPDGAGAKLQPYYFGGYGHFGQVIQDLPNFPDLGASIIQEDIGGPAAFIEPDGRLTDGARAFVHVLQRAAKDRMKVDFLISPHDFPDWTAKAAPDSLLGGSQGSIHFNIDHPVVRRMLEQYLRAVGPLLKNESSLFSFCLNNEPTYYSSGRDPYSRPLWAKYLKERHQSLSALNALYGTHYSAFDEVPTPALGMPSGVPAQRAYWDWVRFNQIHFAGWHHWMNNLLKAGAPHIPTHAKIMVFFAFNRDALHFGVDPELFCDATDIAGCDAYAFPTGGDEVYGWESDEMWYDLLHSFKGQPVFNSENHVIPDNSPPDHFPPAITRAAFWQGGLHHQGATTMWVWEEGGPGGLDGSVYFRPANVYSNGRAWLDLNRLSPEVTAINQARPEVALLYSMPSIFWEPDYGTTVTRLYTALSYSGIRSTFVSERQLQSGRAANVQWIIVPHATHVKDSTVKALRAFVRRGGHVLFAGDGDLAWDEYHQPRTLPLDLKPGDRLALNTTDPGIARELKSTLTFPGPTAALFEAGTDQPTWHIEYRVVVDGGRVLVPLINFGVKDQTVRLVMKGNSASSAVDLLSGEKVDLSHLHLDSITPRLLEITR